MKHIEELRGYNSLAMFNWNITNGCNYKCSYCASPIVSSNYWFCDNYKLVVARLKTLDQPFRICVAGGEPSLHKKLFEITQLLSECNQLNELIINTNLSRSVEYYSQFNRSTFPKLSLLASYHPEYNVRDHNKKYLAKCKAIHDADVNFMAVIMVSDKREHWQQTYDCLQWLHDNGVNYHMTLINPTPTYKPSYDADVHEYFKKFFDTQIEVCEVKYNDGTIASAKLADIQLNNHDKFHGFNCKSKIFRIESDGMTIVHECTGKRLPFVLNSSRIDETIVCPLQQCQEDIRLYFDKWRSDDVR